MRRMKLRLGGGLGLCYWFSGSLSLDLTRIDLVILGCLSSWYRVGLTTVGRSPQGKVVAKQLHDESAVTVGLLRQ